jgi:hypothetical protein
MANFAKLGIDNVVLEIVYLNNRDIMTPEGIESEEIGIAILQKLTGHLNWKQTSKNTDRGIHGEGRTPIRKNSAGVGFTYDSQRDAFIPPKPVMFNSWVLDEEGCYWKPPVDPEYTKDSVPEGKICLWNESTLSWELVDRETIDPHGALGSIQPDLY